jgi:hypothetical protein
LCNWADFMATTVVNTIYEIVDTAATNGYVNFAFVASFVVDVGRFWPGYFDAPARWNLFLVMLQHVGVSSDYAPVLTADINACIDELRCAFYCVDPEQTTPFKAKQIDIYHELTDEYGNVQLINPANAGARELLDVVVKALGHSVFEDAKWDEFAWAASQADETAADCTACLCLDDPLGDVYTWNDSLAWVGAEPGSWGANEVGWNYWQTNDTRDPGALPGDNRMAAHIYLKVPRGTLVSLEVDYEIISLGSNPQQFRVWHRTPDLTRTLTFNEQPLTVGQHTATWTGEISNLDSLEVFLVVDSQPTQGALSGEGRITEIRVGYDPGTQEAQDVPTMAVGSLTPDAVLTREWYQVWSITVPYFGGGGDEYRAYLETSDTACFRPRHYRERPAQGVMSQCSRWWCDGSGPYTFEFVAVKIDDENWKEVLLRSPGETTCYFLLRSGGNEP